MKKSIIYSIAFIALSITIISCSASKEARNMKKKIKGDWILQTINTEGIRGKVTAKLFNETSFNCFVGSTWKFVRNNTGNYAINSDGKDCNAVSRPIRWSIYEPEGQEKKFQFKRLDNHKKDLDNGEGFRMTIVSLTDTTMQLKSNITFEGNTAAYIYNFVKNNH